MKEDKLDKEDIEKLKQSFLKSISVDLHNVEVAVNLVRMAIHTTKERMKLGYLPNLQGDDLLKVITMEYLYRNTDLDNLGYNEPVCCTPFYFELVKKDKK